jgi:hypothetical protein
MHSPPSDGIHSLHLSGASTLACSGCLNCDLIQAHSAAPSTRLCHTHLSRALSELSRDCCGNCACEGATEHVEKGEVEGCGCEKFERDFSTSEQVTMHPI